MTRQEIASHLTFWFLLGSGVCGALFLGSIAIENMSAIAAFVKGYPALAGMLFFWSLAGASFWYGITR